jgi:predicted DNA binding CopG/RHH family protein
MIRKLNKVRIAICVDAVQLVKYKKYAEKTGVPYAHLIRVAMKDYLRKLERKERQES